jgi:hypothetical protein
MKIFLKISFILLLLSGCKEPSITGPGDKVVDDTIEYEIVASSDQGIEADSSSEFIIESKEELNKFITNKSDGLNLNFIDKLLTIDLEQKTLLVITYRTVYSNSSISIDSLYINNNGSIGLDYTVIEEGERENKVKYLSVALLLNKKIKQALLFRKRIERRYINNFDGYKTVARDLSIDYNKKWKEIFNNELEFRIWATKVNLQDLSILDSINFNTQTLITVGTGYFTSGEYDYSITDIESKLSYLEVRSEFSVINHMNDIYKPANHFVVVNKTNKQIRFARTEINQNDALSQEKLYYEDYRSIRVNANANMRDSLSITKANNASEIFSALSLSNEINPATLLIDFEFFDVLVVKTGPLPAKQLKAEVVELNQRNGLLTGKLNLRLFPGQGNEINRHINIIKVIKTDTELDSNFEVRIF